MKTLVLIIPADPENLDLKRGWMLKGDSDKNQFCSCLSYPADGLKSLIPQVTESLPAILLMTQNVETRNVFLPSNSVI